MTIVSLGLYTSSSASCCCYCRVLSEFASKQTEAADDQDFIITDNNQDALIPDTRVLRGSSLSGHQQVQQQQAPMGHQ
jgi:hypothetical protein